VWAPIKLSRHDLLNAIYLEKVLTHPNPNPNPNPNPDSNHDLINAIYLEKGLGA
jgi:hypothetical protein